MYKIVKSLTPEKGSPSFGSDLVSADNLFRFQSEVIRKLAAEESCVIMGRCADYVLEGAEGLVRVFLYADMEYREKRISDLGYYEPRDIRKNIKRIDRGAEGLPPVLHRTRLGECGELRPDAEHGIPGNRGGHGSHTCLFAD